MGTRLCKKCQITKDLQDFRRQRHTCKKCEGNDRFQRRKALGYFRTDRYIDKQRAYRQRWRKTHPESDMLLRLRNRAKAEGIPFNLTKDDIVIPDFCPVLGIKLSHHAFGPMPTSPSLDKVVPSLGYVKGNVHVISMRANHLKNNGSLQEMERVVSYIRNHFEQNQLTYSI